MKRAASILQRVLGFIFVAFGLNGFVHFIPQMKMPNPALEFFIGLAATGYMLPLLFITQAVAGALLLVGLFVPLALALLAPVIVNIFCFMSSSRRTVSGSDHAGRHRGVRSCGRTATPSRRCCARASRPRRSKARAQLTVLPPPR